MFFFYMSPEPPKSNPKHTLSPTPPLSRSKAQQTGGKTQQKGRTVQAQRCQARRHAQRRHHISGDGHSGQSCRQGPEDGHPHLGLSRTVRVNGHRNRTRRRQVSGAFDRRIYSLSVTKTERNSPLWSRTTPVGYVSVPWRIVPPTMTWPS